MFATYEAAYLHALTSVHAQGKNTVGDFEQFGLSFGITPQQDAALARMFNQADGLAFNRQFAQRYAVWIIEGRSDPNELLDVNPHAADYQAPTGRNAAYGPRLHKQLEDCLQELHTNPQSRRASILILEPEDQVIRLAKRDDASRTEYPCTIAYTFFVRDNQLHMHTTMRSNNVLSTMCYDLYIARYLMNHVAAKLHLNTGIYYHHIINAHILAKDTERTTKILAANNCL